MVKTIEIAASVMCRLTVALTAVCPWNDETDRYKITIEWNTTDTTYEKHDLRETIKSYSGAELTQESLCQSLHSEITGPNTPETTVTIKDTEHMNMTVKK